MDGSTQEEQGVTTLLREAYGGETCRNPVPTSLDGHSVSVPVHRHPTPMSPYDGRDPLCRGSSRPSLVVLQVHFYLLLVNSNEQK